MTEPDAAAAVTYRTRLVEQPTLADFAVLAVKLLGLYALIGGLPDLVILPFIAWENRGGTGATWMQLGYVLPHVCDVAIGMLLLGTSGWMVAHVLRVPRGPSGTTHAGEHVQAMAFSVAGVMLMVWGIAGVAGHIGTFFVLKAHGSDDPVMADIGLIRGVQPFVELVLGAIVFLRSRGLVALWHRMRYGGVRVRVVE